MPKVLLFADKKFGVGLGHFSRCNALLEILKSNGFEAYLLDASLLDLELKKCDLIVIDSYVLGLESYQKATTFAAHCLFFDDTLRLPYPNAILLNNAPNAQKMLYQSHYPNHTLCLGSDYRLLQKPFSQKLNTTPIKSPCLQIKKILITLGGEDILNLTSFIIEALATYNPNYEIHYIHENTKLTNKAKGYYGLTQEEMADLFYKMDLCICACGQTLMEIIASQTPRIALEIAPNQNANLTSYAKAILPIQEVWNLNHNSLKSQLLSHLKAIENPNLQAQQILQGIAILNQSTKWDSFLQNLKNLYTLSSQNPI